MARKRGITLADIANSRVGRANSKRIAKLWPTGTENKKPYSKYKNIKVEIDGIKFDSIGEGDRYKFLRDMQGAGVIKNLRLQVPYELTPKYREKDGTAVRAMKYIADFVYILSDTGDEVVEDFKGRRTQSYIDKRKLMMKVHGIEIYETNQKTLKEKRL